MHDIIIRRTHTLPPGEARVAAEKLAVQLQREFKLSYEWSGDTLRFQRTGVSGELSLQDCEACIQVRLGFLLRALKPRIEAEIHRHFDEQFGR